MHQAYLIGPTIHLYKNIAFIIIKLIFFIRDAQYGGNARPAPSASWSAGTRCVSTSGSISDPSCTFPC